MKLIFYLIFIIGNSYALTITSLNIEWFGRGGEISGTIEDEYRVSYLKKFLLKEIPPSDIFVFQEVTNKELLQNMFSDYKCYSYDRDTRHQFVVICVKDYEVLGYKSDELISLASNGLRPAMGVHILYGEEILSIVGVHLKASPRSFMKREKQVELLAMSPLHMDKSIIIGDFNSFPSLATGSDLDDAVKYNDTLSSKNFFHLDNLLPTYLNNNKRILDHVWARNVSIEKFDIYGPCRKDSVNGVFQSRSYYERFISDHCALQVIL
jgi:endonuclease/exonuclease/phosphatase family metal-dependent hydrolase